MAIFFPSALLVLKADEIDTSNFEQRSLLMMAQMSFYYPRNQPNRNLLKVMRMLSLSTHLTSQK
jgi:hypothetical protein